MSPEPGGGKPGIAVAPGMYHFMKTAGEAATRFHLRVEPDGSGLLLANAAEAAHLSPVGVLMADWVLRDLPDEAVVAEVKANFHGGTEAEIADDLFRVHQLLTDLSSPDDNYPITNFGGVDETAHSRRLGAPFAADVVQGTPEQMGKVIGSLWKAGIPHVTFLVQPERDPQELVRAVEIAEDLGMITGIRTVASWLSEDLLRQIAQAGLDHCTLVFASCDPAEHNTMVARDGDFGVLMAAIDACNDLELCVVAQIPLTDETAGELEDMVEHLAERGVRNFAFYAIACLDGEEDSDAAGALPARALPQFATVVSEAAERVGARLIWEPPVKFDLRKSLPQHVIAGPRACGDVAVRVEADGTVFPARGPRSCAGNVLTQSWAEIWGNECFTAYREAVEKPKRCADCPDLALCAAACPKDPNGWSDDTQDGEAS